MHSATGNAAHALVVSVIAAALLFCVRPVLGQSYSGPTISQSGYRYDRCGGNPLGGSYYSPGAGRYGNANGNTYLNTYGGSNSFGAAASSQPYSPAATISPFPRYVPRAPSCASSYSTPYSTFKALTPRELHEKIIWSAASQDDQSMLANIQDKQLRVSPEAPETIQSMWEAANYFVQEQKPNLAEPLLKELIVTIESHPITPIGSLILPSAKATLADLQTTDARVASTPVIDPRTLYVAHAYTNRSYGSVSYGSVSYGYGSYGGGCRHWGHAPHYHSGHSYHFSGGGHFHPHIRIR